MSVTIGGEHGTITIKSLSRSIDLSVLQPTLQEPDIQINHTTLDAWKHNQLEDADALLITAIHESQNQSHGLLAARALIRARLQHWDDALADANAVIEIQPSVIAYIAKGLAHVGKGEKSMAYRARDIAFEHFHSSHVTLILLTKSIIVFLAGEHHDAISRMDDLIATVPFHSTYYLVQAYMYLIQGNAHVERSNYQSAIQSFECARARLPYYSHPLPLVVSLMSGWKSDNLHITIRQRLCETLYAGGRKKVARESLLEMVNTFGEKVYTTESITKWVSHFTEQCLSAPESAGNTALSAVTQDTDTSSLYATATPLLREWAKARLSHDSWKDVLRSTFVVSRFMIYKAICEHLETIHRIKEASECFHQMKLETLADAATGDERHDDAISHYAAALSLKPAASHGLLIKRSKVYLAKGLWTEALNDANKVVEVDPLSPWGYERKHAALHMTGEYQNAVNAFEEMLSRISQSSDQNIRALHCQYVNPGETRKTIQRAVQDTIRDLPRVLINTHSGRLCDKSQQAASFESHTVFNKLVSSMTTWIDNDRIKDEVTEYYRYGMFSHKWEDNEPLFESVVRIIVHDLEESPTHDKLKMFCRIVQDVGFHWAWSDTCCINKAEQTVLQEALVSIFKWYEGSELTVVFLFDVLSPSRRGDLMRSIWNSRAWTFQEYHASKVVRFYTKDWTSYLNLDVPNHKESPEIISEMNEVTGVSARVLMALQPGLDDIRQKLCLASTRQTTLVEDAAYSLLGIFSMSLPVVYGEGDQALGRLLAQLLTSSGDTSILAWTGKSGSFNSCLPTNITVFKQFPPSHIPPAIASTEMDKMIAKLRASSLNLTLVMKLHNQLDEFPVASFSGQRMRLPCLTFKLGAVTATRNATGRVFRAQTDALGIVEIGTEEDLSRFNSLFLVHPWLDFLLDQRPVGGVIETIPEENAGDQSSLGEPPSFTGPSNTPRTAREKRTVRFASRFTFPFGGRTAARPKDTGSLCPPSSVSQEDRAIRAFQVIARLSQPFGALLLTPDTGKIAAYRRVAAETLITCAHTGRTLTRPMRYRHAHAVFVFPMAGCRLRSLF
ncbi:hypothetical protein V8E55_003166 [Tylopilus felleus]